MTTFIYDTKSIMSHAWEIARETHSTLKRSVFRNSKYSVRNCLADAMTIAWSEAKAAMAKATTSASKKSGRYVELLAVAERDGLNHGRSWALNSDTCSVYGINPMHEGELVCYVYAN